jgi:hypothetical protein
MGTSLGNRLASSNAAKGAPPPGLSPRGARLASRRARDPPLAASETSAASQLAYLRDAARRNR